MSISKVNVSGTDHQIVGSPRYATCSTAAETAAKVATIADGSSTFSLEKGARICVSFTYANTASAATLNVASTGAKAICWQGSALVSSQYWQAGAVVDFVYDGNGWSIVGVAKDNNSTNFLPLSGGSLTGNLTVGSSSIGTNGYIEGTWLKTTKATESAGNFATISGDGWIYKRAPANVLGDIGGQSKITANGILKGDGTGTITAADETEVELVDLPIRAESIIIPKGRMRGDVDGDGKITQNDVNQTQKHNAGEITLTGADLWCADINGDGSVDMADFTFIRRYLNGFSTVLTVTPTFADYYNHWTYVKVDDLTGYWTTEISIAGLTTSNNVIVNIGETFSMGQFYKAEVSTGKVKIYATRPPINDIPATVVISSGSGKGSIPSYLNDSSLEYKFSLSLPTASWTGSDPYTQTVTIPNSTANTKVDIQPSEEVYSQLVADNVGYLAIKNVDGTLTAVAKGGKPSVKLTVQVTYNNVY
ncbi:MAG: dockerin type I repeat-containing protein [Anaerobutyricum hallii]|uniref:dockerin type I repeat-containing protein n=1 Tax=Anaerobutyricum hallii TaxID=39488 RepID=UPI002A8062BE|nr:dockerin type I repeat-containing protein [Anaerobutyricum hallii]MDY4577950.1 dockerin type I repeat-containing protein [Anaerobutyricum hallii]